MTKETLIKCLRGRIAALRGARNLAYLSDMSRLLRSVRLALHPARRLNQRFPNYLHMLLLILSLVSRLACADVAVPGGDSGQDIEECFRTTSHMAPADLAALNGQRFSFAVDLGNSPGFSMDFDAQSGSLTLLYRMAFNNVAEGWSWQPQSEPAKEDYYRVKFLPLKSTQEEKAAPVEVELYPGKRVEVSNLWRYDYFLAFENLYAFYPRAVDDNSGFGGQIKATGLPARDHLKMLAIFRLKPPYHAESNTFWKADFAHPVDLTLRKRYLFGQLEEIRFVDSETGNVYLRQLPGNQPGLK